MNSKLICSLKTIVDDIENIGASPLTVDASVVDVLKQTIAALHPQPAELAEQQGEDAVGDQLLDELRDVEDYFNDVEPNPIHLATVQAAIFALAATGKQQAGEVQANQVQPVAHSDSQWIK